MKDCGNTYIPQYSSEDPCEFISSDCVLYEQAIAYLGLTANSTVTEVIQALLLSLQDTRYRLQQIESGSTNTHFAPIEENQYGEHPAFESPEELYAYLLTEQ